MRPLATLKELTPWWHIRSPLAIDEEVITCREEGHVSGILWLSRRIALQPPSRVWGVNRFQIKRKGKS